MKEAEEAMAKFAPTMDEMREAMEKAGSALDEVGEFDMETEGDEYVERLSQNVKGRIMLDPSARKILILLPDDSLWRQNPDGRWDGRTMNTGINEMAQLREFRRGAQRLEGENGSIPELNTLPGDAGQN